MGKPGRGSPEKKRRRRRKSPLAPGQVECKKCCPGSGNAAGHRGRHATKPLRPRKDPNRLCPTCAPGSRNMEGHRGRCSTRPPREAWGPWTEGRTGADSGGTRATTAVGTPGSYGQ
jgi:hypothetical protein